KMADRKAKIPPNLAKANPLNQWGHPARYEPWRFLDVRPLQVPAERKARPPFLRMHCAIAARRRCARRLSGWRLRRVGRGGPASRLGGRHLDRGNQCRADCGKSARSARGQTARLLGGRDRESLVESGRGGGNLAAQGRWGTPVAESNGC